MNNFSTSEKKLQRHCKSCILHDCRLKETNSYMINCPADPDVSENIENAFRRPRANRQMKRILKKSQNERG